LDSHPATHAAQIYDQIKGASGPAEMLKIKGKMNIPCFITLY